jgi:hypothetical protein
VTLVNFSARYASLALALALAACATEPAPLPITSLDARDCAVQPDLGGARALPLDTDKPVTVTVTIDRDTACWAANEGAKSSYVAFRLTESTEPYLISVTSVALGNTLFAPRLALLDDRGEILRRLSHNSFVFHGSSLYAGIRVHPDERYLIVASDPDVVGQQFSQISGGVRSTVVPVGVGGFAAIYTGSESTQASTYAHNGRVTVSAQPVPKAN